MYKIIDYLLTKKRLNGRKKYNERLSEALAVREIAVRY